MTLKSMMKKFLERKPIRQRRSRAIVEGPEDRGQGNQGWAGGWTTRPGGARAL